MLKKYAFYLTPALILAGCAQAPIQQLPVQKQPIITKPQPSLPVIQQPQAPAMAPVITVPKTTYNSFSEWKADFIRRTVAKGYNAYDVQRFMSSTYLDTQAISLDSSQPEFSKMAWDYADSAVSSARVRTGKRKFAEQRVLLNRLQTQYGVDAQTIAAIWGMESSFGASTGSSYLPNSLSSLAYEGRRRKFAEDQLLALMTLLQRGDVYQSQLKGSWAGGMGHTQFIPTTWLAQSVDGNNDGRHNPWTVVDALSSTANYLKNSGWVRGLSPIYEARLPASFNFSSVNTTQTAAQWRALGVIPMDGSYLAANTQLKLWLPAGKNGPALLLSSNFDVIKVYNNSSNYALGVSLLGRALVGQSGLQTTWPRYEKALSNTQVTTLQTRLTRAGYDTKGIDGIIGTNTRLAFARWQKANGKIPDGFITQNSAASLIW